MNFNMRSDIHKDMYKDLSADKIFELEKLRISKQLDTDNLYNVIITKIITIGCVIFLLGVSIILPLGLSINNTIKHIYIIKYNYVLIDNNLIKKEDSKQILDLEYKTKLIKYYSNSSTNTPTNIIDFTKILKP